MGIRLKKLNQKNLNKYLDDFLECLGAFGQTKVTRPHARLLLKSKRALGHIVLIAVKYDRVIGTATLIIEPKFLRSGSVVGHIEDVAVIEKERKNGIGKFLVERLCKIAKSKNCYKVILDCADHNMHFYEGCGFHKHENCMRIDLGDKNV